jgi:hypothetical protein
MEEVCLRPTATEVDDYAEYKRLRKQHRERKRKTIGLTIDNDIGQQLLARVAPPIAPPTLPPTIPSVSSPTKPTTILRLPSETATQRNLFRHPRFDLHEETHHEHLDVVSPGNVGAKQPFWSQQSSLTVPQHVNRRSDVEGGNDQSSISQGSMTSTITTATNPPPTLRKSHHGSISTSILHCHHLPRFLQSHPLSLCLHPSRPALRGRRRKRRKIQ